MKEYFISVSYWLDPFFLIYFFLINITYLLLLFLGSIVIYKRERELESEDFNYNFKINSLPIVTFLLPFYNESDKIVDMVENLLNITYPQKKIILINDGSIDNSFDLVNEHFKLVLNPEPYTIEFGTGKIRGFYRSRSFPNLFVIDKEHSKKADSLNAALNFCNTIYTITIDADTTVDNIEFNTLIRPILNTPTTIAVGAGVRIRNGCTYIFNQINTDKYPPSYSVGMQANEYLRAFIMREGWNYFGGSFVLSGAFSIFSTETLKKIKGFGPTTADDLEIILRLHRIYRAAKTPYKIFYLPDPVAWTEGPPTIKRLSKQRRLWQKGTLESIWFHKSVLFNPKYGFYGLITYPFLVFAETIEPLIECVAYLYIIVGLYVGGVNSFSLMLLLLSVYVFNIIYTLGCILLEELSFQKFRNRRTIFLLTFYTFLENLGFRQLSIWWRLQGIYDFIKDFPSIQLKTRSINELIENILSTWKK